MPTRFGRVEIFTSWTVKLDGLFIGKVGETAREKRLLIAENSWAATKVGLFVFFKLRLEFRKGGESVMVDWRNEA